MTPQPPSDPYLRNIARDVRLISYRAGVPNPVTRWLFLALLAPFLLIFVAGFFFEVAIQLHLMKPAAPRRVTPTKEVWPPAHASRFRTRGAETRPDSFQQPQSSTGETK